MKKLIVAIIRFVQVLLCLATVAYPIWLIYLLVADKIPGWLFGLLFFIPIPEGIMAACVVGLESYVERLLERN